jgi:hypothetical protein
LNGICRLFLAVMLAPNLGCEGSAHDLVGPDVLLADVSATPCEILFGQPTETTGLGPDACAPSCACGVAPWTPLSYGEDWVADLGEWTFSNPPALVPSDPYKEPAPEPAVAGSVCAARFEQDEAGSYRLDTFSTVEAATAAGAVVTHAGACGLCSSLQNLAVYMGQPDLTDPVRQCGLEGLLGSPEDNIACLETIGFDGPCAQIWYFNTNNTRTHCLEVCMAALDEPHHMEDGNLNPCIQCDEDVSGPVFKAVAGRTRRNSGLASALCRPCESVYPLEHVYP